jgi:hypothetical protein
MENPSSFPSSLYFHDYCLYDEKRAQTLLDTLFDPHKSLPETIQKHMPTIKSYLSNGQSFEDFCKEGKTNLYYKKLPRISLILF